MVTLQGGGAFAEIVTGLRNYAPFPLDVEAAFGSASTRVVVPAHTAMEMRVRYDPRGRSLVLRSPTWRPADTPGMGDDQRTIGICVTTIDLR